MPPHPFPLEIPNASSAFSWKIWKSRNRAAQEIFSARPGVYHFQDHELNPITEFPGPNRSIPAVCPEESILIVPSNCCQILVAFGLHSLVSICSGF